MKIGKVDKMPVGPELDALVAHLIGFTRVI